MVDNRVAILTTIFPMNADYLNEFFASLASQTHSAFDVVVVNDGYGSLDEFFFRYPFINIIEVESQDTPAENRERGLKYAKEHCYDIIIFADSDDWFDRNRVEKTLFLLDSHDVVVNDISLFDDEGIYSSHYFLKRISEGDLIDVEFILDKNIFGMSNSAFTSELYDGFSLPSNLVAVDWYLFTRLLLAVDRRAVFTAQTQTYYREYESNTVGMKRLTETSFRKGIDVKKRHYHALLDFDDRFKKMYQDIHELESIVVSEAMIQSIYTNVPFPLWWENIMKN